MLHSGGSVLESGSLWVENYDHLSHLEKVEIS
jgi:hypothetical protein